MNILLLLIPISLVLIGVAIAAFVWAVRRGQFEDLDAAALDVLVDEAPATRAVGRRANASSDTRADRATAADGTPGPRP